VLHHIANKRKDKYTLLDVAVYFFVFTTPLFELPQAYLIYSRQDASGVSLLTWGYFAVSSIAWLAYGLRKRLKPIVFTYSLYLVIELSIVVGIVRYGPM
jgi:uncharacterized protein with PQ loop repeat